MGNTVFRQRSFTEIPPEIVREIFGYLPGTTVMNVSREHYKIAVYRLPRNLLMKILHKIVQKNTLADNYPHFHGDMIRAICNYFDIGLIFRNFSFRKLVYIEQPETMKLRKYLRWILEYNRIVLKRGLNGSILKHYYLKHSVDIILKYITKDFHNVAEYAIMHNKIDLLTNIINEHKQSIQENMTKIIMTTHCRTMTKHKDKIYGILLEHFPELSEEQIQKIIKENRPAGTLL